jgi:signal transduction histidine kinase
MLKSALLSVLFISSLNFNIKGIENDNSNNKNVLILFSLVPTTPAYRIILEGIREKLTEEFGESYSLNIEYLETERYPEGEFPNAKFNLYNKKYEDVKLDLLICVGIDIVSTVKKNADRHLLNLPAITIDYDFSEYGKPFDLLVNNHTTQIGLKMNIIRTINEAISIFPPTSSIYFIFGTSRVDQLFLEISKESAKQINNQIKTSFITDMAMGDILKMVNKLPENSMIIVGYFTADRDQVPYYLAESVRLIRNASNAPVFTYTDMGFGDGSFGGNIMSFRKIGPLAGETAVKILNGTDPDSIKISESDYYEYLLDWRELKKWNLAELEKQKKGCTVLYKEVTFFGKHILFLFWGILFLFLQSYLIVSLFQLNRKQKKMTRQIVETERRQMSIVTEDRILRMGIMSASLSHELNQPLTAILSTAQAGVRFIDSNKADNELLKNIFNNIVEDDKRAASILSSIRGMMKLESREKVKSNLNNMIIEVADLYRRKAIESNFRIILQLADIPVFVFADSIQIQQVLLNFLSNAYDSMEISTVGAKTITISESIDKEYVSVSVRDYGKGIDESVSKNLFNPFVTSRKEGTGVGLAISRFIIEDHQGKIWAKNMPEGGAEFSFKLKIYHE